jgi:branched-chain amino acid transport system ATP-binding protein
MTEAALLEVSGLQVSYGESRAISDVSFAIRAGAPMALLGANGAGKSSLARALAGLVKPERGRINFLGEDITGQPAHVIRRLGLMYLPESRGIFPTLTVTENLATAVQWCRDRRFKNDGLARVLELFPVLAKRSNQRAGTLSGGEQQMLALARGLAIPPRLLITDELSLGLAPLIVDSVFQQLAVTRELGTTVLVVEQFVNRALDFADDAMVLSRGTLVWSGAATAIGQDEVIKTYMGH